MFGSSLGQKTFIRNCPNRILNVIPAKSSLDLYNNAYINQVFPAFMPTANVYFHLPCLPQSYEHVQFNDTWGDEKLSGAMDREHK